MKNSKVNKIIITVTVVHNFIVNNKINNYKIAEYTTEPNREKNS